MRVYSPRSVTLVVDGRPVVVLGADVPAAELARLVADTLAARETASVSLTVTTTASDAAEIRLCAMANGSAFDALDAQEYEPTFPAPPPPAPRRRARPVPVRRPPAAPRLVSWLVEGRGR